MTDPGRSFADDIRRQPENLRTAAATFVAALEAADLSAFAGGPVVVTGMGASLFAGVPMAAALRSSGRPAIGVPPTELLAWAGLGGPVVGISQSGRSAETVQALRALPPPRLALTTTGGGPLAEGAELALPIGSEPDAGISVLTYTASLAAGAALAMRLGSGGVPPPADRLADATALVVDRAVALGPILAERFGAARALDAVGEGFSVASAGYAALLAREAARLPASWFDTRQYLHGPVEVAEPGLGVLVFGDGRGVELARDLAGYGATVLLVTSRAVAPADRLEVFVLPEVPGPIRPVLEAVPAQVLAAAVAEARGLSPGAFRREQPDAKVVA